MNVSCNYCRVFIHLISLIYTVKLSALLEKNVLLIFRPWILEGLNENISRKTGNFIHSAFLQH